MSIKKEMDYKIYSKYFKCSAEPGDDFTEVVNTQWGYQNISNKDFSISLESAASKISVENGAGDWMTINSISIVNGNDSTTYSRIDQGTSILY